MPVALYRLGEIWGCLGVVGLGLYSRVWHSVDIIVLCVGRLDVERLRASGPTPSLTDPDPDPNPNVSVPVIVTTGVAAA